MADTSNVLRADVRQKNEFRIVQCSGNQFNDTRVIPRPSYYRLQVPFLVIKLLRKKSGDNFLRLFQNETSTPSTEGNARSSQIKGGHYRAVGPAFGPDNGRHY